MALGKHNARVRMLSERIARTLGNAMVAPIIAYVPEGTLSPPTCHIRLQRTITPPEDLFRRALARAPAARPVRAGLVADGRAPGAGPGAAGDPRRASAGLGRLGVDLIVARTVAAIKASTTNLR